MSSRPCLKRKKNDWECSSGVRGLNVRVRQAAREFRNRVGWNGRGSQCSWWELQSQGEEGNSQQEQKLEQLSSGF